MNNGPSQKIFCALPHSFAIQLTGADAAKVVNNLSTNDIGKLPLGTSCETFITEARGRVVAHAGVLKGQDEAWLLGSHPSPDLIASHLDRYIIREAAAINNRSEELELFTLHNGVLPSGIVLAEPHAANPSELAAAEATPTSVAEQSLLEPLDLAQVSPAIFSCLLPIWGAGTQLLCCPREQVAKLVDKLHLDGFRQCEEQHYQWLRVSNFWPLQTADISDKTIPQELDRDPQAISFTKGCYLGQETIARLDARGQLQKKLCLVELAAAGQYTVGDPLYNADKEVGHITSLARSPDAAQVRALAYLRRGNFQPATQLSCGGLSAIVVR